MSSGDVRVVTVRLHHPLECSRHFCAEQHHNTANVDPQQENITAVSVP